MKTLVIYHKNCSDGFGAAWAAYQRFGSKAEYVAAAYGEPLVTDVTDRDVYLVDFSYPRAVLDHIRDLANSVTVFDHHETAKADLEGWDRGYVIFDMERSGAGITWDEMHPGTEFLKEPRPRLISYIEDRDLWRWKLPFSREVSAYIMSYPYDFKVWAGLDDQIDLAFGSVVKQGAAILRAQQKTVEMMADQSVMRDVGGYWVPVVNATAYFSEVGQLLCERFPTALFSAYYLDRADGKRQWGLRSKYGFDVSKVAKMQGGGGNPATAGFVETI